MQNISEFKDYKLKFNLFLVSLKLNVFKYFKVY